MASPRSGKNEKIVDIHGREVPFFTVDTNKTQACFLSDVKQTGVMIFPKHKFQEVGDSEKEFDDDFNNYMLEAATSYMIANKKLFTEKEIIASIENCKETLNKTRKPPIENKTPNFSKTRQIEAFTEDHDNIQIKIANTPPAAANFKPTFKGKRRSASSLSSTTETSSDAESSSSKGAIPKNTNHVSKTRNEENKTRLGKKISYNMTTQNMGVIVTSLNKPNCVWVRATEKNELFADIQRKVNDAAKTQKVTTARLEKGGLYMAQDEDVWFRCKVVKVRPLTVFFLDYGNVVEVKEVKELPEEVGEVPPLAFRITFKEIQYKLQEEDQITIKAFHKNSDGTLFVNILGEKKTQIKKDEEEEVFFKKSDSYFNLKDGQRVVICNIIDQIFYLKTKEGFEMQQKIEAEINKYIKDAKQLVQVKENQLVLYQNEKTHKIYRGCVKRNNKGRTEIECLDFAQTFSVDLSDLLSINQVLATQPVTYFSGGRLQTFEDKVFNDKQMQTLRKYIDAQAKFTVILGFDDELDLKCVKQGLILSDELNAMKEIKLVRRNFVNLKDMKVFKPQMGVNTCVCGSFTSSKTFSLIPSEELTEHADYIMRSKLEDNEVYVPQGGEICLSFFVDSWYRCVILRSLLKEYEVLLLDFGNVELIKKSNIRKADKDIFDIPILALPCVLQDVPQVKNLETLLKQIIIEGEVYSVNFVAIKEGKYLVEMPSVYKKLREL